MLLQEEIVFTEYFRVYCLGCKAVKIMQYEPQSTPSSLCIRWTLIKKIIGNNKRLHLDYAKV
jgi:hypothetical protein